VPRFWVPQECRASRPGQAINITRRRAEGGLMPPPSRIPRFSPPVRFCGTACSRRRGRAPIGGGDGIQGAGCPIAGTLSSTQREGMRAGRPRSRVGASSDHSCSSISSRKRRTWEIACFSVRRGWGLAPGGAVTREFRRFDSAGRCQCGCEGGGCHCGYRRRSTGSIRPIERPDR